MLRNNFLPVLTLEPEGSNMPESLISFSSFDIQQQSSTNSKQIAAELADKECSEKEDSEDSEKKFTDYDSSKANFPNLLTNLAWFNTDRFVTQFFASVPVSPPNS